MQNEGIKVYGPTRNRQQGTGRGTPIDVHGCGAARLVHPDLAMGKCSQGHGTDMGAGSVTEVSVHRQKLVVGNKDAGKRKVWRDLSHVLAKHGFNGQHAVWMAKLGASCGCTGAKGDIWAKLSVVAPRMQNLRRVQRLLVERGRRIDAPGLQRRR